MKTNNAKRIHAKKLKGRPNKKEKKALRLLRDWHKKAGKKKGFSGKLSRGGAEDILKREERLHPYCP